MTYIPKHQLSGEYKLNNPPTEHKPWTARKTLIVAAAGHADREKLKTFYSLSSPPARDYVQDCIEACVNDWRQKGINQRAVDYYNDLSDRATKRLILAVVRELWLSSATRLTR